MKSGISGPILRGRTTCGPFRHVTGLAGWARVRASRNRSSGTDVPEKSSYGSLRPEFRTALWGGPAVAGQTDGGGVPWRASRRGVPGSCAPWSDRRRPRHRLRARRATSGIGAEPRTLRLVISDWIGGARLSDVKARLDLARMPDERGAASGQSRRAGRLRRAAAGRSPEKACGSATVGAETGWRTTTSELRFRLLRTQRLEERSARRLAGDADGRAPAVARRRSVCAPRRAMHEKFGPAAMGVRFDGERAEAAGGARLWSCGDGQPRLRYRRRGRGGSGVAGT